VLSQLQWLSQAPNSVAGQSRSSLAIGSRQQWSRALIQLAGRSHHSSSSKANITSPLGTRIAYCRRTRLSRYLRIVRRPIREALNRFNTSISILGLEQPGFIASLSSMAIIATTRPTSRSTIKRIILLLSISLPTYLTSSSQLILGVLAYLKWYTESRLRR
jgi:hypothetical protein